MPALRINMRKLKDALRLKFEGGQSHQQIATALGISKGVVTKYVGLAIAAGLNWQTIADMDEATLERRLLASPSTRQTYAQTDFLTSLPNRAAYHRFVYEMKERFKSKPFPPVVIMMIDIDNFKTINDKYATPWATKF